MKRAEHVLLFLTLLFLPTQLGKHFWPQFSYIYSLKIDYLAPTLYFWDLLVLILIIVWVSRKGPVNKLSLNLFLLFILTQIWSLIPSSVNLGAGIVRVEQYLICGLFGVYLASQPFNTISQRIFSPLVIAIFFESVLAIAQFFKGGTIGLWILGERSFSITTAGIAKFDFYGREFLRPYATFPHPNVLAAFLVITLLLLSLGKSKVSMTTVSTILGGIAVFMTVSRAVLVAGVVAGLLLLTKRWKMVLVLLILILSPLLFTRFASIFNYDQLTFLRREELNEAAFNMFLSSPIFGIGLNNFIPAASDKLLAGPSRFLQPVHNIFLLTLSETGVIGVMGLIGLIGYPIFALLKLSPKPYTLNPLLLVWGTIFFLGLFDHYFLTLPQGYRLLFLVWGLSLSMLELKDEDS